MRSFAFPFLILLSQDSIGAATAKSTNKKVPKPPVAHPNPYQDRRSRPQLDHGNYTTVTEVSKHHPVTDGNIHHAVKQWMKDRESTLVRFGHIRDWDTSKVTRMDHLFSWERSNSLAQFRDDISAWNTSSVTNMSHIFYGNSAMNLDLGQWNVRQVVDMSFAFASTKHYKGHGLVSWDTSKLVNASNMFHQAAAFNSHSIHRWDVRSLVDASQMFHGAKSFEGNHLWKWNSHNLQDISEMFAHASSFEGDLSELDVSSVTDMKGVFFKTLRFNGDLTQWKTDNVQDMNSMFAYAASFQGQGLEGWNVAKVSIMANMLKRTAFNQNLGQWNVESVTDMRNMFRYVATMNQQLCWTLNKHVDVEGIFFQSNGHFNRSCVKRKFVVQSCCRPNIDNACRCGEIPIHVNSTLENVNSNATHASVATQATSTDTANTSLGNKFADKTQYLTATLVASLALSLSLLITAIGKLRRRWFSLTTTTIECGGADDLDISDLDIPSSTIPYPSGSETSLTLPSTDLRKDKEGHGPMEDISVREII